MEQYSEAKKPTTVNEHSNTSNDFIENERSPGSSGYSGNSKNSSYKSTKKYNNPFKTASKKPAPVIIPAGAESDFDEDDYDGFDYYS